MVDPQAQIQLSRSYTPFGEELASSGSYETPFGFAGEMQDASGLLYLRARYLSTETGRFTSVDAFSGYLNYPASMNPYQYAYNNPLKYVDPSGNIVISALQWAQVGMDLYSMVSQYADRNCTTVEQLTRNVLAGVGSVAAGIAVGAVVGALGVALFPGSLLAAVAFGALGGAMAGQYSRLVSNLILGRDPTEGMYNPGDMLIDGLLGGIGGAAGFLSAAVLKATGGGLALALGLTVSVDVGIGELAYAVNQRLHGEEYEFSWQRVAINAAISTVTFGVGYGIGKLIEKHFVIFNRTHKGSQPKPKGIGPNGGRLNSHHPIQQGWATANLPNYDPDLAPTITIETGTGYPHTTLTNLQNQRRISRIASGEGAWGSSLQNELQYIADDFLEAGFSKATIKRVLEQQYKMLHELGVPYERINVK